MLVEKTNEANNLIKLIKTNYLMNSKVRGEGWDVVKSIMATGY
jgi:hypothetical protein